MPYRADRLTFDGLVDKLRSIMGGFPDPRKGNNIRYSLEDAALGAFAVFFNQSPSWLDFQRTMDEKQGKSNAQTLFGINNIPTDNHIRFLLDGTHPSLVFPLFADIVDSLRVSGELDGFRAINNTLLVALDGTQYFSSCNIHCKNCTSKTHNNGTVTYSHSVITPVIVAPGNSKVIALAPEFITPQDGHDKQDCENAAAKRWMLEYAPLYTDLRITILGDDLYCRHPICALALKQGFHFIFVCKPDSHKTLYLWVSELEALGGVETLVVKRCTGKSILTDTYRFVNKVPLRDGQDAVEVNWCQITTTRPDGRVVYKNAFATDHEISRDNVQDIVKAGRARWKVENENNNTLKTKGYHLEHNFGHGNKYLSMLLLTLNLLAFLFHTVLGIVDTKYQLIRNKLVRRQTFFDDIRAITRYLCFKNWDEMLRFMMRGLELEALDTS